MNRWRFRLRCSSCGNAHPDYADAACGTLVRTPGVKDTNALVCPTCGGAKWDDPRPGRRSAAAWWNPSTWFSTQWEWRDDEARPLKNKAATPSFTLMPGGKS